MRTTEIVAPTSPLPPTVTLDTFELLMFVDDVMVTVGATARAEPLDSRFEQLVEQSDGRAVNQTLSSPKERLSEDPSKKPKTRPVAAGS